MWFHKAGLSVAVLVGLSYSVASQAQAPIRYDLPPIAMFRDGGVGSILSGFVVTDGTLGDLSGGGVLDFEFLIAGGQNALFDAESVGFAGGLPLTATPQSLSLWEDATVLVFDGEVCTPNSPPGCEDGVNVLASQPTPAGPIEVGLSRLGSLSELAVFASGDTFDFDLAGEAGRDGVFLVNEAFVSGDYNGDGVANLVDAATWDSAYGATVSRWTGADGNGDGLIDAADYTVWRDAFFADATAIPEPGTLAMLATGSLLALRFRP